MPSLSTSTERPALRPEPDTARTCERRTIVKTNEPRIGNTRDDETPKCANHPRNEPPDLRESSLPLAKCAHRAPALRRCSPAPLEAKRVAKWKRARCDTRKMLLPLPDAAEKVSVNATLRAVRILSRVLDAQLQRLRKSDDALVQALARIKELEAKNGVLTEMVETFQTRLRKLASKKRPHFSGPGRFKALEIRHLMGWSIEEAAAQFVVTPITFARWEDAADPVRQTVGPDIRPDPPVRRYADVVRNLARFAERLGIGKAHQISAQISRAGWKISKSYVTNVARTPGDDPTPGLPNCTPVLPLKARFKGHVYVFDSHEVKGFLGLRKFSITGVLDGYSQALLGAITSDGAPNAAQSAHLLKNVIARHGKPKYIAIDRGPEFEGAFEKAARKTRARFRYGSPGKTTITGIIERFWRTLDELIEVPTNPPVTLGDFERRLGQAITYYNVFRPVYALDAATPTERLLGIPPLARNAIQPPRGRPGECRGSPPMAIGWLDPHARRFLYLVAA